MRRPCLSVLLCLLACTTRNPAFDGPGVATGGADGDSSSTTAAVPTTSSSTSTSGLSLSGSASESSESSETFDPTTSPVTATTTTDPTTGPALCPSCEPCHTCVDGQCVPDVGAACDAPVDTPCEDRVWGVTLDGLLAGCHRFAPGIGGTCDAGGACTRVCEPTNDNMGDNLFTCDTRCVRDDHQCTPGASVEGLGIGSLCVQNTGYAKCTGNCEPLGNMFNYRASFCSYAGLCEPLLVVSYCFYGQCTETGCVGECDDDEQCIDGAQCKSHMCQP